MKMSLKRRIEWTFENCCETLFSGVKSCEHEKFDLIFRAREKISIWNLGNKR